MIFLLFSFPNTSLNHLIWDSQPHWVFRVCEWCQVLLSLDEHVVVQAHTVTGVAQTTGLSLCIFMSTYYQEEASVGVLGVELSGG